MEQKPPQTPSLLQPLLLAFQTPQTLSLLQPLPPASQTDALLQVRHSRAQSSSFNSFGSPGDKHWILQLRRTDGDSWQLCCSTSSLINLTLLSQQPTLHPPKVAWSFSNSAMALSLGFLAQFRYSVFFFTAAVPMTQVASRLCSCVVLDSDTHGALTVEPPGEEPPTDFINPGILRAEAFWPRLKQPLCSVPSHEMRWCHHGAPCHTEQLHSPSSCSRLLSLPPPCTGGDGAHYVLLLAWMYFPMFLDLCRLRGPWNLLSHINGSFSQPRLSL